MQLRLKKVNKSLGVSIVSAKVIFFFFLFFFFHSFFFLFIFDSFSYILVTSLLINCLSSTRSKGSEQMERGIYVKSVVNGGAAQLVDCASRD